MFCNINYNLNSMFERFPEEEILVALDQMLPQNNRTLRRQEFDALRQATTRRREFQALR
jgi:ribosomal protein L13